MFQIAYKYGRVRGQPSTMIQITNLVAKCSTSKLDLDDVQLMLAAKGYSVSRKPKFCGMFLKLSLGTCTFFSTGTTTLNGVKSFGNVLLLHQQVSEIFAGENVFSKPTIVNIVAKLSLGYPVVNFHTETQNSIEIRIDGVVFLVHHTGNCIVTGGKSVNQLEEAISKLPKALKHKL